MKKKILAIIMTTVIIMPAIACGSSTGQVAQEDISVTNEESNLSVIEAPELSITFECTSSEIAKHLLGEESDCYTNVVSGYTVDTFRKDYVYVYIVTAPDEEYPGLIYIYDPESPTNTTNSMSLFNNLLNTNANMDDVNSGNFELDDGYSLVAYLCKTSSDTANFPIQILQPDNDFILSLGTDTYNDMIIKGQYNTLYNNAQDYINANTPPTYDNAYWIVKYLEPIVSDWNNVTLSYDEFSDTTHFYYKNLTEINSSTHFIPYGEVDTYGFELKILIGFYASEWLFFDEVEISCEPDNISIGPVSSKTEEVINGSTILEYIDGSAYVISNLDENIENLLSSEDHTIRFINDNDKYYDFSMSKDEIEALRVMNNIKNAYHNLQYIARRFEE